MRSTEKWAGRYFERFHPGYSWDQETAQATKVRESEAKLLLVVRAISDVVAGKTKHAPWMEDAGLEGFCRALQELHRMWKRYLTINVASADLLAREQRRQWTKAT